MTRSSPRAAAAVALCVLTTVFVTTGPQAAAAATAACPNLPRTETILEMDAATRTREAYGEEQELRAFALYCYRNIAGDLIDGRGLYLETLRSTFAGACDDAAVLTRWMRELLKRSPSVADFARRLALAHAVAARD